MKHSDTRPEASPNLSCVGCGAVDRASKPLPWQVEYGADEPRVDYYCEKCYRDTRRLEETQEAIIAAIKAAKLHETYTIEHLQSALDDLASNDAHVLAEEIARGTTSRFKPRTIEAPQAD